MTRRKTKEQFVNEVNIIHNYKYNYDKFVYLTSRDHGIIYCPVHKLEFPQTPTDHLSGHGCNKCGIELRTCKIRSSTSEFIAAGIAKYGNKFDYSEVNYINNHTLVRIKCPNHGFIMQHPHGHLHSKTGCSQCSQNYPLNNQVIDEKIKNRTIIRLGNYINTMTQLKWQCLICQYEWDAIPDSVVRAGRGCIKCGGRFPLSNDTVDARLIASGTLIKRIDNVITARIKINFQCLVCEFIWPSKPDHILNSNSGCPECNVAGVNESRVKKFLEENNINFNYQNKIYKFGDCENKRLSFDFYFPALKLAIEYQGHQHYQPVKFGGMSQEVANENFVNQQQRDNYKRQFCQDNDIKLIEIDGRKYHGDKLLKYLQKEISPMIQK